MLVLAWAPRDGRDYKAKKVNVTHEEIDVQIGQTIEIQVSKAAYLLLFAEDGYEKYVQLEPLPLTFCHTVHPPACSIIAYSNGHAHLLIWPISEREPEWLDDFACSVKISDAS